MIEVNKGNLDKASQSVYYRAFNLYPGNIILEKWRESKKIAEEDIKARYEKSAPDVCESMLRELNNFQDGASWMHFIVKKYLESFETK